jgi:hypothetical protein
LLVLSDLPPIDPLGPPPYGLAQVCLIRPHTWSLLHKIPLEDNGQLVGATRGPSFFCYVAHPGSHQLDMPEETSAPIELELAAGQRVYVHQRVQVGSTSLRLLPSDEANLLRMLEKCEYSTLLDWPGKEIVTEAYAQTKPPVR